MTFPDIQLNKLSSQELVSKKQVLDAYGQFWNNIRFKKGWDTPAFNREDVEDLLDLCAEIVVRIRTVIDSTKKNKMTLRIVDGSAREYMWTISQDPRDNPEEFIRGIVLANFMDMDGYVEGLTEDYILRQIDGVLSHFKSSQEVGVIASNLTNALNQVTSLWNEVCAGELSQLSQNQVSDLKDILNHLNLIIPDLQSVIGSSSVEDTESESEKESMEVEINEIDDVHEDNVLQVRKVETDVSQISEQVHEIFENVQRLSTDSLDYELAKEKIGELQKKASVFSNQLINDMLELDSIVGDSNIKPLRKKNVIFIQSLLNDLDKVTAKLSGLQSNLEKEHSKALEKEREMALEGLDELARMEKIAELEQALIQKEEERAEHEELARMERLAQFEEEANAQNAENSDSDEEMTDVTQEDDILKQWKQMRLRPKFTVDRKGNGFILQAYIPGINKEDIDVNVNGDTLVLAGLRLPTEEDLALLQAKIDQAGIPSEQHESALLRLGAGRYGRFSETFQLPHNTDIDNIKATYQGGVLRAFVPVNPQPRVQRPPVNPFFSDDDLWW
eukprot:TRINITY_DN1859_c0_g1_i1.p1 TRINITY_DN1859_c0_g1~~TRINITY_DN1859_c0_g1_i1.p1  ORF type:complete len:570 (-),score=144.42 TRINITY_DN1859_c0_g1_i1:37-1716(-)